MALFPDRIVQKNSTDTRGEILDALGAGGLNPIVSGELVVQRAQGAASLITLDAQGKPVVIGTTSEDTPVAPAITLNFEDASDTPYLQATNSLTAGKFGANAWLSRPTLVPEDPRRDSLLIDRTEDVPLSSGSWTIEFWIKGIASQWNGGKYALIANKANYIAGPGALNIYLDGGSPDRGGGGSNTSYTEDQALGSIVFGLSVGDLTHNSTDPLIPLTGEIVTTRAVSVLDDAWHHVAISHEGGGIYAIFADGQLNQRTVLSEAIDHSDPGDSGIVQPSGWDFGGTLIVNDQYPDTGVGSGLELPGGRFAMDSFALYRGLAKYKGLYSFPLPGQPVDPAVAIRQPVTSLESLIDTDIPASPTDGSILVYNAPSESWRAQVAPPYSLTGNSLSDIGDVTLPDATLLSDLDFLKWDETSGNWVNAEISLERLNGFQVVSPQEDQYLGYDASTSSWVNQYIQYDDIVGRPTSLNDLTMDLSSGNFRLDGLGDVQVNSLSNNNVLVYKAADGLWTNETAPAPDLAVSLLEDIGDVVSVAAIGLGSSRSDAVVLSWDYSNDRWIPSEIDYADINGQPTALSQFTNNLSVGSFSNNVGYLTATTVKSSIGPEDLDNTNIISPAEGQVLVYRSGNWKNEAGQPANISFSSIGELNDVTYFRPNTGIEGEMTFEGMGLLNWDSPYQPTNIRFNLHYRQADQALGMEAIRTADETGSSIHVSRGGGVDIRSDVNFIRLRGKPDATTNRPAVYFETGDSFAAAETGEYIAFQMPEEVDESVLYRLPSADGDSGDVLATDGTGRLTWVARVSNNNLGALEDVDLITELPVEGSALVYNAAAELWVPGESTVDLAATSINELADVDTSSIAPTDKQGLGWDAASSTWAPMNVIADVSELSIRDLADVTSALPSLGDILVYSAGESGTDLSGAILAMPLDGTAENLGLADTFTFAGSNIPTSNADAPAGASGGSLQFLAGNGRLEAPDNAVFDLGSDSFTAEVWFKGESAGDSTNDTVLIFGQRDASNSDNSCFLEITERTIKFQFGSAASNGTSNQFITSPTLSQIQNDTWHHVAVVREGIEFRLYLDGVLVHTQTNSGAIYDSGRPFLIGTVNDPAYSKAYTFSLKNLLLVKEVLYTGSNFAPPLGLSESGAGYAPQSLSEILDGVQVDLSAESIDALADVDTTSATPSSGQALLWDGANWAPGDVQVDEASPAVIWNISANGLSGFVFEGPGFPEPAEDPNLYVIRGQNYTFNKTLTQHPFQVQEAPGLSQPAYTRGFTGTQPLGEDVLSWVVPMDAPSVLYYQCTLHAGMNGVIYVLNEGADSVDLSNESIDSLQDVDTTSATPAAGQALVWDGANWVPGNVVASGVSGSAISQRATESQASDVNGLITYVDLGTSGTMVSILSDKVAWVTLFATETARTADGSREFGKDPQQGSGVLAEFSLEAGVEVLTSPSTNYFNANAIAAEEIYALVRNQDGTALETALVTINAYSISGYTAVFGGTFGSG